MHYRIEEFDAADPGPMAALWTANLQGYDDAGARTKLHLGYAVNPAGGSTLLALYAGDQPGPQGSFGLHARIFHFGPRRLRAATAADFVVGQEHRSLGPAMQLVREGMRVAGERFDFMFGFPNARAKAVFTAARLKKVGEFSRWARPLRTRKYLAGRMPGALAGVAAPLADLALRMTDAFRARQAGGPLACRDADWDDPALATLWQTRPADVPVGERTPDMLRWRFGLPGRGNWRLTLFEDRAGQPCGYAVWRDRDGIIEVGDCWTADPARRMAAQLLALARRLLQVPGAYSLSFECLAPPAVVQALARAGLRPRAGSRSLFVHGEFARNLDEGAWFFTSFDEDAS